LILDTLYQGGCKVRIGLIIKYRNTPGVEKVKNFDTVLEARAYFNALDNLSIEYAYLRYFKVIRNHVKEVLLGDISHLSITEI